MYSADPLSSQLALHKNLINILVKPLHPLLKRLSLYQGTTLLNSGRPALVLNLPVIAEQYDMLGHQATRPYPHQEKLHFYLLFTFDSAQRYGLPLQQVLDLERFQSNRLPSATHPAYQKGFRSIPVTIDSPATASPGYILFLKSQTEYAMPIKNVFEIYSSRELPAASRDPKLQGTLPHASGPIYILDPQALYTPKP